MSRPAGVVDGLLADRYRVAVRLVAGATGEMWRAEPLLDRPVAVTTLHPGLVDDVQRPVSSRAPSRRPRSTDRAATRAGARDHAGR